MSSLSFRKRVLSGDKLAGTFLNTGSPTLAEIAGRSGLDWCLLDMEHGAGSWEMLAYQLMALEGGSAAPIVRLPAIDPVYFKRALDLGAWGLMLPNINTPEEARTAVSYSRYPPHGSRGVATMNRSAHYGSRFDAQLEQTRESTLIVAQIESPLALENLDDIAATEGIDALFIGPMDLSVSLGNPRQFDHPDFVDAIDRTIESAKRHRKASGILGFTAPDLCRYYNRGFNLVAVGSDGGMVATGTKELVSAAKEYHR